MAHDDPTGPVDLLERDAPALAPESATPAVAEASAPTTADPTGAAAPGAIGEADLEAAAPPQLGPALPLPIPLPLRTRNVTGRYRGQVGSFQLEVRVDLDGAHPLNKVSGDFYSVSGGTTTYFGSFIVDAPVITRTAAQIVARGLGRFTFGAGAPVVQVTIPRRTILLPAAPATVQFFSTSGAPGATYV
ncbi:MAG TPA: hypothetical protein VFH92_12290, partial [Phenylobacterium sp.]|nr:hypothetical protein [Phenylobacterium sp.]